jgi:predicted O-linked N-acetylglucosamine transferase (SPINDLY family)
MAKKTEISTRAQQHRKQILQLDPEIFNIFQKGLTSHQSGQLEQAKAAYEQVLNKQPKHFNALHLLGVIAAQTKNPALADELIGKAIEINPNAESAHFNRGNTLKELKRLDDALASFDKAIALRPDFADAFNNRGNTLNELKRLDDALASFDKAIALWPDYADAFNNRGNTLNELKRLDDALASFDKAIALRPDYAVAFNNRGNTLNELKRLDDALASFDKAIALRPDYAVAFYNRGNTLNQLKRLDDALASFDKAIALWPDYADAFNNRGITLDELKRLDDALASFDKAIALRPDFADAFNNHGNALDELNRLDDALASYDKVIALRPDYKFLRGTKLHTQMRICNWSDLENQLKELEASIAEEQMVTLPFPLLGLTDRPDLQLKASRIYANEKYPAPGVLDKLKIQSADGKIRIGYYSPDFRNHVVSDLIVELFELHNSDLFEVYGFSFGPSSNDAMRQRVSNAFYRFIDVSMKSDTEVAQISRSLGIDIAVDLSGFTKGSRAGIFSARSAPIQVNYLGYPGTMGASYMDYIVADRILIPSDSQQYYSEKIIYLPHSFQVNDSKRKIADKVFTRQDLGLPDTGFVFCCFNNNFKILPQTFDSWMRLLKRVNGSVLWLFAEQPTAIKNLKNEAKARGVDSSRLIFATRMSGEDHLARQSVADLFLDTLPFNAGATASTALWSGLPVLTLIGKSFAARYAASLLNAMDLTELVTKTSEEYESRAVELANDPLKLAQIKKKLEQNRQTSPLFKGQLFARHIEAAYQEIHRRQLSGEQPEHIDVENLMGQRSSRLLTPAQF